MKKLFVAFFLISLFLSVSSVWGYKSLTPAQVYGRLVAGDTLLLLDVREVSEYRAGHIAEPAGQLPITPVNMPLNSNVLSAKYQLLPTDIDIVVYCKSGGRSAQASNFLESKEFTRIHNMTGGFSSWPYDSRNNGYGDHSGQWVSSQNNLPVVITCLVATDTSKIIFSPNSLPGTDSTYFELHLAFSHLQIPPNVSFSQVEGLFRITSLDPFGLPRFTGDSLVLSKIAHISLHPKYEDNGIIPQSMSIYVPGEGWRDVPYDFNGISFQRDELILRKWYFVEGQITAIENVVNMVPVQYALRQNYPNPFNPTTTIEFDLPETSEVKLKIFNILGKEVATLVDERLSAGSYKYEWSRSDCPKARRTGMTSGIYFYRLSAEPFRGKANSLSQNNAHGFVVTKKMVLVR
jgi:rhodanese-related sulfurtransferase